VQYNILSALRLRAFRPNNQIRACASPENEHEMVDKLVSMQPENWVTDGGMH